MELETPPLAHAARARPHPECDFQLDLAVGSGALQREALVQSHVGDVEEATQLQVHRPQQRFLLVLFDLDTRTIDLTDLEPHKTHEKICLSHKMWSIY